MIFRNVFAACALLLLAAVPAAADAPKTVAADTPSATPAGTTFVIPTGWSAQTKSKLLVLSPPEHDYFIVLIDVEAKDAAAAVAAAWAAYDPSFKRPVRINLPQSPYNGWEERQVFVYETSPNEKLEIGAYAWRAGKSWLVILETGSQATAEKRGGPANLIESSARPKGYQRETFAGKKAHPLDAKRIATLKDFIARGAQMLKVPGVGFSLIDNGKVVFEGGVGVRELGKSGPIDANTLFLAASNTKALTTLLLAELVDEKKLRWDEPVTEAYPAFKLGDPETTRQALIKHLICACTGMPREDFEWIFNYEHSSPEKAMALLGSMKPTSHFGEVFQYSNLMAAAAGYIGGSIVHPGMEIGAAYDLAMQEKVFSLLGMTRTTFDFKRGMKDNYARPHDVDIDGKLRRGAMDLNYAIVPARPAGGVWTSVHDLSQYVMLELANGVAPNGKRIVSQENLLARRIPNVTIGEDVHYGMALIVDKRYGVPVVHHGGDLAGYHSDMMWLPEHNVGAVILTNSDWGYALRGPFLRKLEEVLFDGQPLAEAQLKAAVAQLNEDQRVSRKRLVVPADTTAATALASRYRSPDLGTITVTRSGADVVFGIGGAWRSLMATRKNDDGSISFISIGANLQGFEFVPSIKNGKRVLVTRDAQHEYVYTEE